MDVTIEYLNWRGEGVAGSGTFHKVLPGEVVDHASGRVLTPSPERIEAFCPYFDRCGGCQLQHWRLELYQAWKIGLVTTTLAKRGIAFAPMPIIDAHGAGRRRVTLHVRRKQGVVTAGFMMPRSHALVDINYCPVVVPALKDAAHIARKLGERLGDSDVSLTAADNGIDVAVKAERAIAKAQMPKLARMVDELGLMRLTVNGDLAAARSTPHVVFNGVAVQLPPGAFLQATKAGEEALGQLVVDGLGKSKSVADLFCGVGPFALRIAAQAKVTAIDNDKPAIASLAAAVRLASGLKPVKTEVRDLMREPLVAGELKEFDTVVFDPPRAGAEAQARQLARSGVKTVVAVSCDPTTFARDVEILVKGGYELKSLHAVDQFKWTSHVEIVGRFVR